MRIFSRRRFNYIDIFAAAWAMSLINQGNVWTGICLLAGFLVVSVVAESTWGA